MKTIEVYVKSEERLKPPANRDYSLYSEHPCQVKYNTVKALPPEHEQALKTLTAIAKEMKADLKVYDLSTWKGKLKALAKRVRDTPVVIIGTHRISGIPDREELLKMLS